MIDRETRRSLTGVLIYYVVLVAGGIALARYWPAWAELFSLGRLQELSQATIDLSAPADVDPVATSWFSAGVAMIGALFLVIPVAWVYIITKRHQSYDPSVVQTIIILPIAVAGIVLIVQHSITLAFSLAGIVAAVRFRNTLKDTKDAVYVFLAIGVGLSAGVQAFAVALTMSVVFNLVVLALWRFNVGNIYATSSSATRAGDQEFDGTLSVTASSLEEAARLVENVLTVDAKKWQRVPEESDDETLVYLVRFKKKKNPPPTVLDAIRSRASGLDLIIEYQPFHG